MWVVKRAIPASEHVELAKQAEKSGNTIVSANHYGFDRDLGLAVKEWVYEEGRSTLQPKEIAMTHQVQTCAQCHSRRTQLNETEDHVKVRS